MKKQLVILAVAATAGLAAQNLTDQQFVDQAAQSAMTCANLGQTAQQKAASEDIKNYGRKLVTDCKASYQNLTQAANGITVPKSLDPQHQAEVNRFNNLSGTQFDDQFRQQIVQDQQAAVSLYQQAAGLQTVVLKNYASQTMPTLEGDLESGRDLPSGTQSSGAAERSAIGSSNTMSATVTSYQPGQRLEVKIRNRVGRHVYDLAPNQITANVPANLKVGDQVTIQESIDSNGHGSITVQPAQ